MIRSQTKNRGRVVSAAPSGSECFGQLVTGDRGQGTGGCLSHKLAIRTSYVIHSNRFRSKGRLRLPTPAPTDQPHDHEQQHGTDCRSNDLCNNPSTKMNTELGK